MSAILCQKIMSYKGIKIKVSKLTFDTLFIFCSVEGAIGLDFVHSIKFGEKISSTSTKFMCSDFWSFLMNVISKYLFLEQFCQFSEGVLKILSEAGDSIHSFSSCTHIGALKTEWKCRISLKSAYLYTSTAHTPTKRIVYQSPKYLLWSSGKGKDIGSTQEVTQRSFIDYRLSIIDIDFPDALH